LRLLEKLAAVQSQPGSDEIAVAASQETIVAWFNAFGAGNATAVGAAFGDIAKANPRPDLGWSQRRLMEECHRRDAIPGSD
jgi:hypothetical protein